MLGEVLGRFFGGVECEMGLRGAAGGFFGGCICDFWSWRVLVFCWFLGR